MSCYIGKPSNAEIEAQDGQKYSIDEETCKKMGPPAEILDFLILGSAFDLKNHQKMDEMGVGFVLNVAEECGNLYKHDEISYLKIAISDMIYPNEEETQWEIFEKAFRFIGTSSSSSQI
ncbi:MAG: dual specificity protein phosphatase family protein [Pseudarthrobacter sp.]